MTFTVMDVCLTHEFEGRAAAAGLHLLHDASDHLTSGWRPSRQSSLKAGQCLLGHCLRLQPASAGQASILLILIITGAETDRLCGTSRWL